MGTDFESGGVQQPNYGYFRIHFRNFRLPNLNSPDSQELKGLVGFSIDNATVITRASTVSWLLNLIKSSLGESRVSIGFSNLISTLFGTHFYRDSVV